MNNCRKAWVLCCLGCVFVVGGVARGAGEPIGERGAFGVYKCKAEGTMPASVVVRLVATLGEVERIAGRDYQWYRLECYKANGEEFRVWILSAGYPPEKLRDARAATARYLLQEGYLQPLEYVDKFTGKAVLPCLGFWKHQIPRAERREESEVVFPRRVKYLGLPMELDESGKGEVFSIPNPLRLELLPDVQIGTKYNVRDKREARRYDPLTDDNLHGRYEMVPYERTDFPEMLAAGETTFNIVVQNEDLFVRQPVFYQGPSGSNIKYPETLYRSNYLGQGADYLDEPGGQTSRRIKEELSSDAKLRENITPQVVFEEFRQVFRELVSKGRGTLLMDGLKGRKDVDVGDMSVLQANMYTWDGNGITAAYQLKDDPDGLPSAIVNEWTLTFMYALGALPVLDAAAEVQIPLNNKEAIFDAEFALLRGAARVTGKKWGIAIYGADVSLIREALRCAYDAGASYFLFWTTGGSMHVPYLEQLEYSRYIRSHAKTHPERDMEALKHAAEVIILIPPGYSLVEPTCSPIWWIDQLNLERKNQYGLKYREIIHRIGMEMERCYRQGVCYDLAWDLDGLDLSGYREVVRVKEDGKIQVTKADGSVEVFDEPRPVQRPEGEPPELTVTLSAAEGTAPLTVTVRAEVKERSAAVVNAPWQDESGVWRKGGEVMCEVYGPEEWDFRGLGAPPMSAPPGLALTFERPGTYRLRACAVDVVGRTTVVWKEIRVDRVD